MRPIYQAPTEDAGAAALATFAPDWRDRYPPVVRSWEAHGHERATFYRYPEGLRRTIYTTNPLNGSRASTASCAKGPRARRCSRRTPR